MITKTASFQTTDGKIHGTIAEAQAHELTQFLEKQPSLAGEKFIMSDIAALLIKNSTQVVDLLTTTASSRAKARTVNGATRKKRKPAAATATVAAPAATAPASTAMPVTEGEAQPKMKV